MSGCFYSVGVGPGDPELITLKAVRCIRRCPVIMIPTADRAKCMAYGIARQAIPELDEKEWLAAPMPMTKDGELLRASHESAAKAAAEVLIQGRDVAFLTIGDPTVYATSMYVHRRMAQMGFKTEIISGVPSFCAAAARLGIPLAESKEEIHVIPASYGIQEALTLSGTKIFMKAGKKMPQVKEILSRHPQEMMMVENCGMENERVWLDGQRDAMPEQPGYYTLVIVKENENRDKE